MSAPTSPENTPVVEAQPQRVYTQEDGDVLAFHFSEGAIFTVFDPHQHKGASFLISSSRSSSEWVELEIQKLQKIINFKAPETLVKVIGTAAIASTLAKTLSKSGITPGTTKELTLGTNEVFVYTRTGRARVARDLLQNSPSAKRIRVLIVDDSKTIRNLMSKILSRDPGIEVVGLAEGPTQAEALIEKLRPDVITLDIHMPEMDGVQLLKRYLPKYPIPTVMISSISMEEGPLVLSALEVGAVEYIQKPSFDQLETAAPLIVEKVKVASYAKVVMGSNKGRTEPLRRSEGNIDLTRVIAIGSSTGGTEALRVLMSGLPADIPPIVVVQHIPPVFSKAFAMRMNELFPFEVKEAEDGDLLQANRILIAPGGLQMSVVKDRDQYKVQIRDTAPVNRHKPSVDVLFDSIAKELGNQALGAILTGMGTDGAKGLLKMRQTGAHTVAQDEASCIVFGMPREAIHIGAAVATLPLSKIASHLMNHIQQNPIIKKSS
jgi:two-component system chemotaxis response regulator CheB